MAVTSAVAGGYSLLTPRRRQPTTTATAVSRRRQPPPVFISTDPRHVTPQALQNLYSLCSHSPHRFPEPDSGRHVDALKLRTAVAHSDVVVSVFSHPEVVSYYSGGGGEWLWRVVPVSVEGGEMVGFGRAVSDCGLTASIHDVMVLPSLRGMGIGKMIVKRILRVLTSRDIYDISALCSEKERLFFRACGFGNDILESTTMMYTGTASTMEGNHKLLVPQVKNP